MYHPADVEKLARGEAISTESFLAIISDPAAVAQAAAQRELRLLLAKPAELQAASQPLPASPETAPADCDVSCEDLALYAEDQLRDPARVVAVRRFLQRHFPEAVLNPESLVADARLRCRDEDELE